MNDKIKYWVDIAVYDLETAKALLITERFLYVGFMCHQAIEKMLKAYFTHIKDDVPSYIHNLKLLAQECNLYEKLSKDQKDFINIMMPLNIEARYPSYKEFLNKTLNKENCNRIIIKTEEFTQWILMMLS